MENVKLIWHPKAENMNVLVYLLMLDDLRICPCLPQDPAGIFELVEVVGNGTYGQVYKVRHDDYDISELCRTLFGG